MTPPEIVSVPSRKTLDPPIRTTQIIPVQRQEWLIDLGLGRDALVGYRTVIAEYRRFERKEALSQLDTAVDDLLQSDRGGAFTREALAFTDLEIQQLVAERLFLEAWIYHDLNKRGDATEALRLFRKAFEPISAPRVRVDFKGCGMVEARRAVEWIERRFEEAERFTPTCDEGTAVASVMGRQGK